MRYNLPSFLECETVRPHLRSDRRQRRSERFKASPNTERAKLSATRQLGPFSMLCLWAALCFGGGLYGAWQDYLTLAGIWVTVKFSPSHWLWPYPGGRLAYVFTVLLCVNVALAAFVLVRKVPGIGYNIGWGRRWGFYVLGSFLVFGAIAIPLGTGMHFIQFAPQWHAWRSLPFLSIAILFFTAWPEEFLFRGLLQNMLARSSKSDFAGWRTASVLFGFSHITNLGFPNWRYLTLSSIPSLLSAW